MSIDRNTTGFLPYDYTPYSPQKDEQYMSPAQEAHFRQLLTSWKQSLMEEVDSTIQSLQNSENLADPNDQASKEEAFSLQLRTRDRERRLIAKIDASLSLLDNHDYGYCEECGVEIGIRRLEARPTATLCIDCKTLAEVREKRR